MPATPPDGGRAFQPRLSGTGHHVRQHPPRPGRPPRRLGRAGLLGPAGLPLRPLALRRAAGLAAQAAVAGLPRALQGRADRHRHRAALRGAGGPRLRHRACGRHRGQRLRPVRRALPHPQRRGGGPGPCRPALRAGVRRPRRHRRGRQGAGCHPHRQPRAHRRQRRGAAGRARPLRGRGRAGRHQAAPAPGRAARHPASPHPDPWRPGDHTMTALLLCLLVLPLLLPGFALLLLTMAALLPARHRAWLPTAMPAAAPRVVVLVPAHNESAHLLPTLRSLQAQIGRGNQVLVVADNCSDDTAALARQAGAGVVERTDPLRRGKGYALACGIDQLRADPPDVVVVIDADCLPDPGAVADLAERCHTLQRPVQLLNLMASPDGAPLRIRVAEFAMVMKNLVRPLGTQRLGGVCHLSGTGMALPWALAATARLATGSY
jgi:hypothetical protein